MFNLDLAKEIILKKNEDGTYNLIAKMDVVDTNKSVLEMECNCSKVILKNFDVDLLSDRNEIMTLKEENKIDKNFSIKNIAYSFISLPFIIRCDILYKFDLLDNEDEDVPHVKQLEKIIAKAEQNNCLNDFWNEIKRQKDRLRRC